MSGTAPMDRDALESLYPALFDVIRRAGPIDGSVALSDLEKLYNKQYRDGMVQAFELISQTTRRLAAEVPKL